MCLLLILNVFVKIDCRLSESNQCSCNILDAAEWEGGNTGR
jgi:hypothetical protein